MQLRLESRVESLEQRTTKAEASIIQLSSDTAIIRQEIRQGYMDIGKAIDDNTHGIFEEIRRRSEPIERSVKHLEARIDTIEATMAAKDDISALKNDFSALKTTQDEQGKKLDQILHLLQSKQ